MSRVHATDRRGATQIADLAVEKPFSRRNESEADRLGYVLFCNVESCREFLIGHLEA